MTVQEQMAANSRIFLAEEELQFAWNGFEDGSYIKKKRILSLWVDSFHWATVVTNGYRFKVNFLWKKCVSFGMVLKITAMQNIPYRGVSQPNSVPVPVSSRRGIWSIGESRELFWVVGGGGKQDRGAIEALILSAISRHWIIIYVCIESRHCCVNWKT